MLSVGDRLSSQQRWPFLYRCADLRLLFVHYACGLKLFFLQLGIGDGGLYSLWAGLMVLSELLTLLVYWKGAQWREQAIRA